MLMRRLPALCAGVLMLAACTEGGAPGQGVSDQASDPGAPMPGQMTDPPNATIGDTVYFDTDSAILKTDAQASLQKQAAWLLEWDREHTFTIEGHADERGTREYNLALGERRAQVVMDYLIALGVDPKRLKTISYGKERPVCTEPTEACWSQNRRGVSALDQ
jgi:peptidoglycan-associated lipoprotein